jgi:hypothetical protein
VNTLAHRGDFRRIVINVVSGQLVLQKSLGLDLQDTLAINLDQIASASIVLNSYSAVLAFLKKSFNLSSKNPTKL